MAVRDWPRYRIIGLWGAWLLIMGIVLYHGRAEAPDRANWSSEPIPPANLTDSQEVVMFYLLKHMAAADSGDSSKSRAIAMLSNDSMPTVRDSVWNALGLPQSLSAAQKDSLPGLMLAPFAPAFSSVAGAVDKVSDRLGPLLVLAFILQVGAPLALIIMTIRWYLPRVIAKAADKRAV